MIQKHLWSIIINHLPLLEKELKELLKDEVR